MKNSTKHFYWVLETQWKKVCVLTIFVFIMINTVDAQTKETQPYMNRIGGVVLPKNVVFEYERFFNRRPTFSFGVTTGGTFRDKTVFKPEGSAAIDFYAINPFVRYYIFKPSPAFRIGWDVKYSNVWVDPEGKHNAKYLPSVESHVNVSTQYKRVFLLIGVGVKHFLKTANITSGMYHAKYPDDGSTVMAAELSIGYQFN
jgi:hypothetical protein